VLAVAVGLTLIELTSPCPAGGPLSFGSCAIRPLTVPVLLLAAVLYVIGLSAVLAWTSGLRGRGVADRRAARDWYGLAAILGLLITPLLAFTVVSALR
jgi:hypothetical protein